MTPEQVIQQAVEDLATLHRLAVIAPTPVLTLDAVNKADAVCVRILDALRDSDDPEAWQLTERFQGIQEAIREQLRGLRQAVETHHNQ